MKKRAFIIITAAFIIHAFFMMGVYIGYQPAKLLWKGDFISNIIVRKWYEVLILICISYLLLIAGWRLKKKASVYTKTGSVISILFSLLFFFLSGQNLRVYVAAPIVEERFFFIPIRDVVVYKSNEYDPASMPTVKYRDGSFFRYYRKGNEEHAVLRGLGFAFNLSETKP